MKREFEKNELKKRLKESILKIIECDKIWKKEYQANLSLYKKKKDKKSKS